MILEICRIDFCILRIFCKQTSDFLVCVHDLIITGVNIEIVCQHEIAVAANPLNRLGIDARLV